MAFLKVGKKVKEGGTVNKSLLALSNCITVLSEGRAGSFVPYRDSKLTRLLKDSLGGNSKTCMIATVSSAARDYEETVNTLKYAIRAKAIKNSAVKNVSASAENNAIEMKEIIDSLKKENLVLQKQAEEASKAPPRTSKPLQNTESTGLLGELEARLRAYFKEEKSIRSERAKVEEEATALSEEMSQPHSNTDANIVKLSQLRIQKTKLSEDLSQKFRERSNLLEEINESGLTNLQLTYLTNIAVKEQIESVPLVY